MQPSHHASVSASSPSESHELDSLHPFGNSCCNVEFGSSAQFGDRSGSESSNIPGHRVGNKTLAAASSQGEGEKHKSTGGESTRDTTGSIHKFGQCAPGVGELHVASSGRHVPMASGRTRTRTRGGRSADRGASGTDSRGEQSTDRSATGTGSDGRRSIERGDNADSNHDADCSSGGPEQQHTSLPSVPSRDGSTQSSSGRKVLGMRPVARMRRDKELQSSRGMERRTTEQTSQNEARPGSLRILMPKEIMINAKVLDQNSEKTGKRRHRVASSKGTSTHASNHCQKSAVVRGPPDHRTCLGRGRIFLPLALCRKAMRGPVARLGDPLCRCARAMGIKPGVNGQRLCSGRALILHGMMGHGPHSLYGSPVSGPPCM